MIRGIAAGVLSGLVAAAGCLPQQTNTTTSTSRSQAADDPADPAAVATVGQKTVVGNVEPIHVHGVGLVYNLRGTGSSPPPGELRAALENMIQKAKGNVRELLDDPAKTTSLVLVSAKIPHGARIGEKIDVTITLPPGSKTTSLKGGVLYPCDLSNFEMAGHVRQAMAAAGVTKDQGLPVANETALKGNRMAVAEGPLQVGDRVTASGNPEDGSEAEPRKSVGYVWGGARVLIDRPYYILPNDGSPQPRLAMVVAERLNAIFHAPGDRSGKTAEATVRGKPVVVVRVPPAYRNNHPRFLLVARHVPLSPIETNHPYRQQLEHDLVRPETALAAAIKLEALGPDSRQPLRVGLQSDSPWVRFASAEALAYLGHPDGAKDLAELAEHHPALRTHCLTALASMDDGTSMDLLAELMRKPDPELRYGAFVALRLANPGHEAVRGKLLNRSYWLHQVATDTDPDRPTGPALVHVNSDSRAEIVLFGSICPVHGELSIPLGTEFTVTSKGDGAVTVTRVTVKDGEPVAIPAQCRADMGSVLVALAQLGGTYQDAVELIRKVEHADALTANVATDAVPRGFTLARLAQMARSDPFLNRADEEVATAGRTDAVTAASFNQTLPTEADGVQAQPELPPIAEPALNREPGRLFGPKRAGNEIDDGSDLNRDPGRLFAPAKK